MKGKMPYIFLLAGLAVVVFLGIYSWKLTEANRSLKADSARSKVRTEQFQKKFVEQKRVGEELLKLKSILEGRQRNLQSETEKEKESLQGENTTLKTTNTECKKKLDSLNSQHEAVRKELADLKDFYQKSVQEVKELTEAKKTGESKQHKTDEQLDRCRTTNAQLCAVALELLDKYKNKGVLGAMAQKEPLTQIKKAELEQYVEEYKDKIKELKIAKMKKGE